MKSTHLHFAQPSIIAPTRHIRVTRPSPARKANWKSTFSLLDAPTIGRGSSGTVFAIDHNYVIKVFGRDTESQEDLAREKSIYERLQNTGTTQHVVRFIEQWNSGLVLERHYNTLRGCLREFRPTLEYRLQLQWLQESCAAIAFIHERGVIQGDIGCHNMLVDRNRHIKICDFAGSKVGEKNGWICYEVRSQHPRYRGKQPTIETEIFALGSMLFEICKGRPPLSSDSDAVVRQKFGRGEFPLLEIEKLEIRAIIERCWTSGYLDVAEVCNDLELVKTFS